MKLPIQFPIIQAPMAGGITDAKFVSTISNYGCLGAIAGGNLSIEALQEEIQAVKQLTEKPFMVNLFVLDHHYKTIEQFETVKTHLNEIEKELGIQTTYEYQTYPTTEQYVELCIQEAVPIVSFTFGLPDIQLIQRLKKNGIITIGTANSVEEAIRIEEAGMDFVVCQGYEAGGHRGGFLNQPSIGLFALLPQVKQSVSIPIIAAGGIVDNKTIQAANILGADYFQMGTRFLNTYESIASDIHKNAISQAIETATVETDKITGKTARGIRNDLIDQLKKYDVPNYPVMHQMTKPIRSTSKAQNNSNYMSMWAGQNIRHMKTMHLKDVLNLVTESFK
ncbi:nitronate monooxygenase family protein [Macrococcus sp. DPC7161]|uniref:NAD(P)H-dependent flavin oxidoreductase n=1 Tax=Macrococcus sp. DPC7161 TaxID=2507060 RepID=UPI0013E908A2|nr:nitronate monooxygenase [Macrococcus sp. DPC7161]